MLLEGKRGLAKRELPQIILALVVALAVFGPFIKTTDIAAATLDVEKCRLNTIGASFIGSEWNMKVFLPDAPNVFYLDCPKRYAYVSNDNIKVDNVNTKLATDKDKRELREKQLKDFILSEMTKCWKSFGAASDTIYSASAGAGEADIKTDETACFSCSEVFFKGGEDDDVFEKTKIRDFYGHANDKSMIVGDQSYVEFLTGGNAPDELPAFENGEDEIVLEGGQQWSTVFTIKSLAANNLIDKAKTTLGFAGLPPANSGVVDCNVVNNDENGNFRKIDGGVAKSIGCSGNPPDIYGFVFGKVAPGYYTMFNIPVISSTVLFPMTVRFVPTSEVFAEGHCKRLY